MKRLLTYLAILFLSPTLHAQSFNWVKGGGSTHTMPSGTPKEAVYSMCTDYNGNVYTLSEVGKTGPIIADTFSLPFGSPGSYENVMFASYNCSGQMRFAKLISGSQIRPLGLACDTTGHVYMAVFAFHGTSSSPLRIGYDSTVSTLPYQTQMLSQYDTSGHLNWLRFVGNNTSATLSYAANTANSFIAMDGDNNVHFVNTTKYGAPLTPSITSHYGNYDLMYDASGNLLTVKRLQLDTSLYLIKGMTIDKSSGKMYVHGYRDFDAYPDSSYHPYIAAFDTARNLIWKDTLAEYCFSGLGYAAFASIMADNKGSLYMTGAGAGCVVFKTDTFVNSMTGQAAFIMRTDTAGNVRWMRGFSASTSANAHFGITLMPNGNVAAAGGMAGTIVTGTHTMVTYSGEGQNSSFAILDTAGFVDTLHQIHGTGFYDRANCIVSDRTGSLYIGGQVETDTWAGSLTPYTSVGGNSDFYVMKYGVDCGCTTMPMASFTETGTITRIFTYTGTTTPAVDSVRWYFGDGTTSTLMSPTHTYTTADTFDVCMRVYTACGTDLYCKTIIIPCVAAPSASFAMSGTGLTRTFTYIGATTGLTGPVTWTFTGGTGPTSGSPVSHVFPAAGTYTVCVTATNACGSTPTCNPVTITCTSSPVSSFTSSGSGLTKFFIYTGTTAGMDSVTWTFGDGGIATGTTPSHTYAIPGTYTVCAKVWTNCGTHTACSSIVVTCTSTPTASFTVSGSGAIRAFTYTGTTTPAIDSVRWDFGDGGTSTLLSPSHTYTTEDTFHVCVTVYTMCGNNTSCQDVIVTCFTPIVAAFTDTGVLVHGFTYTGTMAGYDSVRWTYGDGGTDTGLNVIHTFAVADTYYVCVTVYTDCGSNTFCRNIIIGTVGISEAKLAAISVFPNPSRSELTVANVPGQMDYRIVNVVGVVMQQGALNQGGNTLPIDALPVGTYLLEMSGVNGSRKVARFVKY